MSGVQDHPFALSGGDHLTRFALSGGDHPTRFALSSGDHPTPFALSSGEHSTPFALSSGEHHTPFALSSGLSLSKTACRRDAGRRSAQGCDTPSPALRQAQGERRVLNGGRA